MKLEIDDKNKYRKKAKLTLIIFLVLALAIPSAFGIYSKNYWFFLGTELSVFEYTFYKNKPTMLFYSLTIILVIYWIIKGFKFSDPLPFYWFSILFGFIFKVIETFYLGLYFESIRRRYININITFKQKIDKSEKIEENLIKQYMNTKLLKN